MKTVTLGYLRNLNPVPSFVGSNQKYQFYWCPATNDILDVGGMKNGKFVKIKRNYIEFVLDKEQMKER